MLCGWPVLDSEGVYHFHNVLSADRTLAQLPTTFDTGEHVSTVEEDTVHRRVHANLAEILLLQVCQREGGREGGREGVSE